MKLEALRSNDPILGKLISEVGQLEIKIKDNHYQSLIRSIIGQQLSVTAAKTIFNRFLILSNSDITPENTLNFTDEEIRRIGISYQKITYIRDLSVKVLNNNIVLDDLNDLSNADVISA